MKPLTEAQREARRKRARIYYAKNSKRICAYQKAWTMKVENYYRTMEAQSKRGVIYRRKLREKVKQ